MHYVFGHICINILCFYHLDNSPHTCRKGWEGIETQKLIGWWCKSVWTEEKKQKTLQKKKKNDVFMHIDKKELHS